MKVFITGGSGYVGSVVLAELRNSGHEILALARSEAASEKIKSIAPGAKIIHGSLQDVEVLQAAAKESDAIIHLGFIHDFGNDVSKYQKSIEIDLAAAKAVLDAIEGTGKAFINTSGTMGLPLDRVASETDFATSGRGESEKVVLSYKDRNVRVMSIRLPPCVHGFDDHHGLVSSLVEIGKSSGVSAYIDSGSNVWAAVNKLDAAKLYLLALEKGHSGKVYHAVAEQGIQIKTIAEIIGDHLKIPVVSISNEEAAKHFGFLSIFFGSNHYVSSSATQAELDWKPVNASLEEDARTINV